MVPSRPTSIVNTGFFKTVSTPAIDAMWMGHFAEPAASPASRERHVRAQRLLFTTLNGLAVEATLLPSVPDVTADLETLTDGIVRLLDAD